MSHSILTMEDEYGNEYEGEETWSNRPWHRFELEIPFINLVKTAFGEEASELAYSIAEGTDNDRAGNIDELIEKFFAKLTPEMIKKEVKPEDEITEEKKEALAKWLDTSVDDIEVTKDGTFRTSDDEEYKVLTDEEADEELTEIVEHLWSYECESSIQQASNYLGDYTIEDIMEYAVDEDAAMDWVREDIEDAINSYDDDYVIERLIDLDKCEYDDIYDDEGEIKDDVDIDSLRETLIDAEIQEYDDPIEYAENVFGNTDYYKEIIDYYNLIDDEEAINVIRDAILTGEGRGEYIATYDGDENEQDGFFIYRID